MTGTLLIDLNERFEKIHKAIEAPNRFLAEHPELMSFRNELERRVRCAGSAESRMTLLRSMMQEKLFERSQSCLDAKKSWEGKR